MRRGAPAIAGTAIALVLLFGPAATVASAQGFTLGWYTIDGGGAMFSTGGGFEIGGTIGQPDANVPVMTGGPFELAGGFWVNMNVEPDADTDGDVDLEDFLTFTHCFNGPNRAPAEAGCAGLDFDNDADVDLEDFLVFTHCFNGPNRAPACE